MKIKRVFIDINGRTIGLMRKDDEVEVGFLDSNVQNFIARPEDVTDVADRVVAIAYDASRGDIFDDFAELEVLIDEMLL